ncbi:MAG: hypothetical protein IJY58_04920 [Alphaproteobacteria bacterium]|nr:hypothetical protein [Alphaproteobacteria bacterium]
MPKKQHNDKMLNFQEVNGAIYSKATGNKIIDMAEVKFICENRWLGVLVVSKPDANILYDYRGNLLPHFENGETFKYFCGRDNRYYTVKKGEMEETYHIPCIKQGCLIVEYDENKKQYTLSTIKGKQIAVGKDITPYKINERLYLCVKNNDGRVTVYDEKGVPEPQMTNVDEVRSCGWDFLEIRSSKQNSDYTQVLTRRQMRNKKLTRTLLTTLGAIAVVLGGKCCQSYIQELDEIKQQDATYLGVSDGVLLFDTDGDTDTAEMCVALADTNKSEIIRSMYKQEGKCRKVAQWCERTGLSVCVFDRVNEN